MGKIRSRTWTEFNIALPSKPAVKYLKRPSRKTVKVQTASLNRLISLSLRDIEIKPELFEGRSCCEFDKASNKPSD